MSLKSQLKGLEIFLLLCGIFFQSVQYLHEKLSIKCTYYKKDIVVGVKCRISTLFHHIKTCERKNHIQLQDSM